MSGIIFYLSILGVSLIFIISIQYCSVSANSNLICKKTISTKWILLFLIATTPIIFIYTVRYGIGTDYFSYEKIYNTLKDSSFLEYWKLHKISSGYYYVELGYFVLCRYLSCNYQVLNFWCIFIILFFFFCATTKFNKNQSKISIPLALIILFCLTFIYSMNGVRFSIALTIILFGLNFVIEKKFFKWLIIVLLATAFHKTSIICVPIFLLTEFSSKKLNRCRNLIYLFFVIFFPLLMEILLIIASNIPIINRYFTVAKYVKLDSFYFDLQRFSLVFFPILPFLILNFNSVIKDKLSSVCFRITVLQLPLYEFGLLNVNFARLVRFPQMMEILFIPYLLSKIRNKQTKILIGIYEISFYITFFCYYALKGDNGDSLIYQTIFNF